MNVLKKLTLKDLKLNIKRTVATIVGIMLSTALVTSVVTMYTSAFSSFEQNQRNTKGNFHLAIYNVSNEQINEIKNNREIEQIYFDGQIGYAKLDGIKNADKPYVCIKAMNKDSMQNLTVNLVEGKLPENENEIVIPTHLKTNGRVDLKVGESITLNVGERVYNDLVLDQNDPLQQSDIYNALQSEDEKERENAQKTLAEAKAKDNETTNKNTTGIDDNENGEAAKLLESPEKIINTEEKTYKIVGIIERPSVYVEPFTAPGYTFITYTNLNLNGILENSKNGSNSNQRNNEPNTLAKYKINLYAHFNEKHINQIYKNIAGILNFSPELYEKSHKESGKLTQEEQEKLSDEIGQSEFKKVDLNEGLINSLLNPLKMASGYKMIIYVAAIICVVIMLASIYCIKNSFDISITEKTKQYGILRSIGATKKQIRKNVFYEATILGLLGIPFGIIVGILATFILLKVSNYYLESPTGKKMVDLELATSFVGIIISAILGIITVYFSAFRSAKKATKVSPIDSIRNNNDVKISLKDVKSPKCIKKLWGIGGEISYKNLKRNKKKYHTTIVSLIVSVILFISSVGFMNVMFDKANNELITTDYNLALFTSVAQNDTAKFEKYINTTKLENIEDYSICRATTLYFENAKLSQEFVDFSNMYVNSDSKQYINIFTVGKEQYQKYLKKLGLNYDDMKNKAILMDYIRTGHQNENEMKIQYKTLHQYNYKAGDEIFGTIYESSENYKIEIGYVTDIRPFGYIGMENPYLVVSEEEYNKIPRGNKADEINIYYKSNNANKLQDDIDKMLQGENYGTTNVEEIAKKQRDIVILVSIFLYGFIIVISLIGITNIFNTITTNMELRKPEFAMLKSVGMTKNEFNKMIRLESMFMGTKSLLIGIPIGIIIDYLMYFIMADGSNIHFKFPFIAILVSICVVFILIFAIMKYSISKVNKQNIIETIRNENI